MRYFIVTSGLRGCYMPDSCYCYAFDTRRALKSYLEGEAQAREGFNGLSKRDVAWAAAHAWRGGPDANTLIPFGQGRDRSFAIELTRTTRKDYLERLKYEGD